MLYLLLLLSSSINSLILFMISFSFLSPRLHPSSTHRILSSSIHCLHTGMSTARHWKSASSTIWLLNIFSIAFAQLRASFVLFITWTTSIYKLHLHQLDSFEKQSFILRQCPNIRRGVCSLFLHPSSKMTWLRTTMHVDHCRPLGRIFSQMSRLFFKHLPIIDTSIYILGE